jgi:hypothetical protein
MTPASIAVILSLIQPACADFILTDIEKGTPPALLGSSRMLHQRRVKPLPNWLTGKDGTFLPVKPIRH